MLQGIPEPEGFASNKTDITVSKDRHLHVWSSPCSRTLRCRLCDCRLSKQRVDPAESQPRSARATRSLVKAAVAMVKAVENAEEAALILLTMTKTWAGEDVPEWRPPAPGGKQQAVVRCYLA